MRLSEENIILKLRRVLSNSTGIVLMLLSISISAQVTSSIDTTAIKIGEQITYKIHVESDTTSLVVFPEGQTFLPLEMIEALPTDTTRHEAQLLLSKKYALTQFDQGPYTIPKQKIIIGDNIFYTDSLQVVVNEVVVDTTKQGLYDIKSIIEVDKSRSKWWLYLLFILLGLGLIAFLLYWFVWREKPLTKEEKVALLSPYERAKLALKELDESPYLENEEIKEYYSELTLIIRKYLDEKVYDHSLESTTQELIDRLTLLKDGNQIDLSKKAIANIENILRRADLVKFAKSKPDYELAKLDRKTVDLEIDNVKESLPEPTEEELLADLKYQEELAKKKKRRKVFITVFVAALVFTGTITGFIVHYGFNYVKDTIIGHPSKELLESKEWVTSEYGAPGVIITTPKVLTRVPMELPEELQGKVHMVTFQYGSLIDQLQIAVVTAKYVKEAIGEDGIDLNQAAGGALQNMEALGVQNVFVKREQFITPNGQEGLKSFGTADFPVGTSGEFNKGNFVHLGFTTENILQQVILAWEKDDVYADEMMERILASVELIKLEEEE